jgi:Mg2+ and Co2+ transporter CorA
MRDLHSHVTDLGMDCSRMQDQLNALVEEYNTIRATAQANVLYFISVTAAIFIPAQFMTGVYGMNFSNMPELSAPNGYYIWWVVVTFVVVSVFSYFRFYKKWI